MHAFYVAIPVPIRNILKINDGLTHEELFFGKKYKVLKPLSTDRVETSDYRVHTRCSGLWVLSAICGDRVVEIEVESV